MAPKVIAKPCPKCGSTEKTSNGAKGFTCAPCRRERRSRSRVAVPKAKPGTAPLSIDEYLMSKKRAACAVCRLHDPLRLAVAKARKDGKRQAEIIEYVQAVHRIKLAPADFAQHVSQRHEQ